MNKPSVCPPFQRISDFFQEKDYVIMDDDSNSSLGEELILTRYNEYKFLCLCHSRCIT